MKRIAAVTMALSALLGIVAAAPAQAAPQRAAVPAAPASKDAPATIESNKTLCLLLCPLLLLHKPHPAEPPYGGGCVDGNPNEWGWYPKQWSHLVLEGSLTVVAKVYLRYDCKTGSLFVWVQANAGYKIQITDYNETYIRLGNGAKLVVGREGGNFRWIDKQGELAAGFEASVQIAPGSYTKQLRIHTKFADNSADGYTTGDLPDRYADLVIKCKTGLFPW